MFVKPFFIKKNGFFCFKHYNLNMYGNIFLKIHIFYFLLLSIMTAIQIIQLVWVLYFILGLAFLFNKKHYLSVFKDLVKSKIFIFIGGYIAFVIGFIILMYFNTFTMTKEWLVSIVWLMALIKWISLLLFPKFMVKFTKSFTKKENFNLIWFSITILWILLMYLGFVA